MLLIRTMLLFAMAIMAAYSQSFARDHINDTLWTRPFDIHGHATARFSPDGDIVAIGCGNGEIRIYNALTGASITTFQQEVDGILALDFSKNGKYLAAGGNSGYISIYDVKEKKQHKKMLDVNIPVNAYINTLCFSIDGKRLYSLAHTDHYLIIVYDAGTFEEVKRYDLPGLRTDLTVSPDSRKLALATAEMGHDVYIEQRDTETLEEIPNGIFEVEDKPAIVDMDYSPDGLKIAAIDDFGKIFIADLQAKTLSKINTTAIKGYCTKYSKSGNYFLAGIINYQNSIVTTHYFVIDRNNNIVDTIDCKFNVHDNELAWGSPLAADFSPNDEYFISAAAWGIALVKFNPHTGVNENNNLIEGTVSPNPASGKVTIHHSHGNSEITSIIIVNSSGSAVKTISVSDVPQEGNNIDIDISDLLAGVYFIRVSTGSESTTYKIII